MDAEEPVEAMVAASQSDEDDKARAAGWPLGREMQSYVERLNSLVTAVNVSMEAFGSRQRAHLSEVTEYAKEHGLECSEEPGQISVKFGGADAPAMKRIMREIDRTQEAQTLIPRSLFVLMISEYDRLLARLLTAVLTLKPPMCDQLDMPPLTAKEALGFGSIEAMREHFIECEIDKMTRKGTADQLEHFSKITGVNYKNRYYGEQRLYEASERRNLYVHRDGVVGEQYLGRCSKLLVGLPQKVDKGTVLELTHRYFSDTKMALLVFGMELGIAVWWHIFPEAHDAVALFINDGVLMPLLADNLNETAVLLGEYALGLLPNNASDLLRGCIVVNTAQAYKWSGDRDKCLQTLAKRGWNKSNEHLSLGAAVLREEYGEAADLMVRVVRNNGISEADCREWPLFKGFRDSKEFVDAYKSAFGKPFQDVAKVTTSINTDFPGTTGSTNSPAKSDEKL